MGGFSGVIDRYFHVRERGSSIGTEIRGGVTTFIVMAYILVVNPVILSTLTLGQGPDFNATVTMTALAAGLTTLAMGFYANYPIALAPGLGLNAFVAFDLILTKGLPWQAAMGVIFIEGLIILFLVIVGLREAVVDAIPIELKRAIAVGIGFFILFIGLVNSGFARVPVESIPIAEGRIVGSPAIPVTLGILVGWPAFVSVFGLLLTAALMARRVPGALTVGILTTTALAIGLHYLTGGDISNAPGVQGALPQTLPPPSFATFGAGLNFGVFTAIGFLSAWLAIFSIMLSDFFDTMGTVVGVSNEAGFLDVDGRLPGMGRVLAVDSLGAVFGGLASCSSVTSFIESAAGVADGARTGLANVATGVLFLLAVFLAPIAGLVPAEAAGPALIVVGFYMAAVIRDIDFSNIELGLPALLTIAVMPMTYSITNGIGAGFILYTFLKLVLGKAGQVHPLMYVVSAAFVGYFSLALIHIALGV